MLQQSNDLLNAISQIEGKDIFIFPEEGGLDFTSRTRPAILGIKGGGISISVPMPNDDKSMRELFGALKCLTADPKTIVIGWNSKDFFSYALAKTNIPFDIDGKLIDLKIIESFCDDLKEQPKTFNEAKTRLSAALGSPHWPQCKLAYAQVFDPLCRRVLPAIESTGLLDARIGNSVHPYYEINGQLNGRLRCEKYFFRSFNPHGMTSEDKRFLKPRSFDQVFIYLDYKHMEASVLQWLSKDELLGKIIASGKDMYATIWKVLTTLDCDDNSRNKCKSLFLPIVYGRGSTDIAVKTGLSENSAKKLVDRVYNKFQTALQWVSSQQASVKDGIFTDYFGKVRKFEENDYRIRNCAIQSPAALICLHKLVRLFDNLIDAKIVAHIHDGYVIAANRVNVRHIQQKAIEILEAEEELYPGLRLKVSSYIEGDYGEHL